MFHKCLQVHIIGENRCTDRLDINDTVSLPVENIHDTYLSPAMVGMCLRWIDFVEKKARLDKGECQTIDRRQEDRD